MYYVIFHTCAFGSRFQSLIKRFKEFHREKKPHCDGAANCHPSKKKVKALSPGAATCIALFPLSVAEGTCICIVSVLNIIEFKFKKGSNNFGSTTCIHYEYSHLCVICVIT